jgi:hypothetical protein
VNQAFARLDADEKRVMRLDTPGGKQDMACINQYGLFRLMASSRKPNAKAFQRWIYHEVLPSIQQTGRYELTPARFLANTERPTQVQNSRDVGALQSAYGGRGNAIRWYRKSSTQITGKSPKEWRALDKARHLPSRRYRRGREVVRELCKEGACAMSLADALVVKNVNETKVIAIGQESIRVFQLILEAGVIPAELHASPLDGIGDEKPL